LLARARRVCGGYDFLGTYTNLGPDWKTMIQVLTRLLIAGVLGSAGFMLLLGGCIGWATRHLWFRERVTVEVPGSRFEIEHARIGIHAMMPEYDREITFVEAGRRVATYPMKIDTCGGYPINVYLIKTEESRFLRLEDALSEHLIDLDEPAVHHVLRVQGEPYFGKLTSGTSSSSWMMVKGDRTSLRVKIDGKPARPLYELLGDAPERYFGRLEGRRNRLRFVPAARAPERKIRPLFD